MPIEIERKFLVDQEKWTLVKKGEGELYIQGYILNAPEKSIRIRLTPDQGFLTIKGQKKELSCSEFEYFIPKNEAEILLNEFCDQKIKKRRYKVHFKGNLWEVDEFLEENQGLIVAEIELSSEDQSFDLPEWVAEEVTFDKKYLNTYLVQNPYGTW